MVSRMPMFTREEAIEAVQQCLNEEEQEILKARWGIDTGIPVCIENLKSMFGITIEQLREIEKKVSLYIRNSR